MAAPFSDDRKGPSGTARRMSVCAAAVPFAGNRSDPSIQNAQRLAPLVARFAGPVAAGSKLQAEWPGQDARRRGRAA